METKTICRVLTGPTASGKSSLGLRLAEEMNLEILCMDSMQIYRGMDIGTAKPTDEDRRRVPHHMLDIRDPGETYSVSEYRENAERLIRDLTAKGRNVLLIGGTVLYLQALLHPMSMGCVGADPALREELNKQAGTQEGKQALHERLKRLDPVTAERLPLNDVRRIIRAIEVSETTGIPFSRQPKREEPTGFEWRIISTAVERQHLYERIGQRAAEMIRLGLRDEVETLLQAGVPETAQSMQGIGYKEMVPCVRNEYTLETAAEKIRLATRHYAKRQMTFLRKEEQIQYIDSEDTNAYQKLRRMMA